MRYSEENGIGGERGKPSERRRKINIKSITGGKQSEEKKINNTNGRKQVKIVKTEIRQERRQFKTKMQREYNS